MSGIINSTGSRSGSIGRTELDYEEGNWDPIITGADGNNATYYSVRNGYYTKIGRKVFLTGRVGTTALGSISGAIRLGNFPFTVKNHNAARSGLTFVGYNFNMSATTSVIGGDAESNTTFAYLRRWNADTGTNVMTATNWSSDGEGLFSIFYVIE